MFDWISKIFVSEKEVCDSLPAIWCGIEPMTDDKLKILVKMIRKSQSKRKIVRFISFGKFPLRISNYRKLNKLQKFLYKPFFC